MKKPKDCIMLAAFLSFVYAGLIKGFDNLIDY